MAFPTTLQTLTRPASTDKMNKVGATASTIMNEYATFTEAIQTKVGIDSSAVTTSHDYKLSGITGSDKAVSKTGIETLTNKTLTDPTITNPTISAPSITGTVAGGATYTSPILDSASLIGTYNAWILANLSCTYASSTTFTIASDQTALFSIGDKVKLTDVTTKYFYITSVSYSAPNTTITVNGGSDYSLSGGAITNLYYSKGISPNGFPQWFAYTTTVTGWSGSPTKSARFCIIGRTVNVAISCSGTSNTTGVVVTLPIAKGAAPLTHVFGFGSDSGSTGMCMFELSAGATNVTVYLVAAVTNTVASWAGSGTKAVLGYLSYEI